MTKERMQLKRRGPALTSRKSVVVGIALVATCGLAVWALVLHGSRPAELYPEFQMFPSARTFDPPGSVFRVNREGIRYDVIDVSAEIKSPSGAEDIPEQLGRRRVEGSVFGNLLREVSSGSVNTSGAYSVRLKLSNVVHESTSDLNLDKALSVGLKQVALRSDNRYYVIRETVAARDVAYELSTTDAEGLGVKVGRTSVGDGHIEIRGNGAESLALVAHYEQPYRLFYKVEEIQIASSGLNGDLQLSRRPVTGVLRWHDSERAR